MGKKRVDPSRMADSESDPRDPESRRSRLSHNFGDLTPPVSSETAASIITTWLTEDDGGIEIDRNDRSTWRRQRVFEQAACRETWLF
jgi:hypothetical protein